MTTQRDIERLADELMADIDAAERDLRAHPATGGRHVYSDTMLPPPGAYERVREGVRRAARPTLLERFQDVFWRLHAAVEGAKRGWRDGE